MKLGILELFMIGIGLSADAFAVAVCRGLSMTRVNRRHALVIALFFGAFQAAMPLIGWLLAKSFEHYIVSFDHWVAFALLAFIGGKMIYESFQKEEEESECDQPLDLKRLTVMAVATSIDALAVGITFAFFQVNIISAISLVGLTTFVLSLTGVYVGNFFGARYKSKAEFVGGLILVLIGLKILIEHTVG